MAVASGDSLTPLALRVDRFGRLAFLFATNQSLRIGLTTPEDAGTARGWTTSEIATGSRIYGADLAFDDSGTYHVIYVRDAREVVYTRSSDGGITWSTPATVAGVEDNTRAVTGPAIAVDEDGGIFVTWTQTAEENNWSPVRVWFARSLDNGAQWEAPVEMVSDAGNGQSAILATNPQTVHLYWNGSVGLRGRYHRYSTDRGATWSDIITAMPTTIGGFAGRANLLLDSANTLHSVVAGLGPERETIWHSTWTGTNWTAPRAISGDLPNSQGAVAAIGQGHVISAVWNELEGGDVWYAGLNTGSPAIISQVLPTPTAVNPTTAELATTTPAPNTEGSPTPSISRTTNAAQDSSTSSGSSSPISAVLLGVLPAALLVVVVIVFGARRRG